MKPEEMINIALQEEVEVEPQREIPKIELVDGVIENGTPLRVARMPLYIALHLQSAGYCLIKRPRYLTREFVTEILEQEKINKNFLEIPPFFFEVARLLMPNGIDGEILELKRIRQSKIWQGLAAIDGKALCINGLTRWEFNEAREAILRAMSVGHMIESGLDKKRF